MRNASLKIYIFFVFINETVVIEKFNVFSLSLFVISILLPFFHLLKFIFFTKNAKGESNTNLITYKFSDISSKNFK